MHGKVPVPNIASIANINTTAQSHQENVVYLYPITSLIFPILMSNRQRNASVSSDIHSQVWVTQFNPPGDLQLHLRLLQAMLDDGRRCLTAENEALNLCMQVFGSLSGFTGLHDTVLCFSKCWGPCRHPLQRSSEEKLRICSFGLIRAWALTHVVPTLALNG